tara:strand:- start:106 stop:492 length:387 start_codon:yes stop_codon:yes gene_type:complete
MIEDDFFATIKLKCGDEIFCKVAASEEDDRTMLLISHPICVQPIKTRGAITGYKFEPWLKTSQEDLFVINLDEVLTMSESENIEMIMNYQDYIRKSTQGNFQKLDRKMGYLGNVLDTKEVLEKLYKSS